MIQNKLQRRKLIHNCLKFFRGKLKIKYTIKFEQFAFNKIESILHQLGFQRDRSLISYIILSLCFVQQQHNLFIRNKNMQPSISTMQWKGSTSQRFQAGKRHLQMQNQLGVGLQANHYPKPQGLRTFNHDPTAERLYKPTLKIFSEKYVSEQKEIDLRGKKPLHLPAQFQRKRPQMSHVNGGQETFNEFTLKGIKTYSNANKLTKSEYQIQNKLQRKARILGLDSQRNYIGVSSMGDKPYKYPQYQSGFYKSGGLIPGSTQTYHSQKKQFTIDDKKLGSVFTKPHWHVKVKMDQQAEQKQIIDSVDEWEKTILKENNPKYQDPDTFFQRMQSGNQAGKDNKKAGKK